jgi:uncharacterized protein DUF3117
MADPVWAERRSSGKIITWHDATARPAHVDGGHHPDTPGETVRGDDMAAMKPRTGDGPLEVTKEGRGIVMRVPLEGGGRLVVEMTPDEATALGEALKTAVG